jgi:deoxyribodipyrimidine photo-lyase
MRQLAATGWMHNRVRMIVASFLTKDLLIDWRWGERHFMERLLDGDLAANNGGWQWAASTGCDPQPYFRVFNPVLQGRKFDPDGDYVRTWVPERRSDDARQIHAPRGAIVDHAVQRERALALYRHDDGGASSVSWRPTSPARTAAEGREVTGAITARDDGLDGWKKLDE